MYLKITVPVSRISRGSSGRLIPNPPPMFSNSMDNGVRKDRSKMSKSERNTAIMSIKNTIGKTPSHSKPRLIATEFMTIKAIPEI
jgi:hypothetical protein